MERELICLDTSVLIDYFRKTDKSNSFLYQLTQKNDSFAVSAITEYEIYVGSNDKQDHFWNQFFQMVTVLPFDSKVSTEAVKIYRRLKKQSQLIDIADLLIGATASAHTLKLATLNRKHFDRIGEIDLIVRNG